MRIARDPRRRGVGMVLIIVLALLAILGAWAFGMSFYSHSTTMQTARAQARERCAQLAQMAVTESIHAIRTRVNNPDETRVFEAFRADDPDDLEIGLAQLIHTAEEVKRFPGYELSPVTVEIPRRTSLGVTAEERVPYEAVGIARFLVTATGPDSAQVTEVTEYGFRSVLTAPPRPLDMLTFFLRDPSTLLEMGAVNGDPNDTIDHLTNVMAHQRDFYSRWDQNLGRLIEKTKQAPGGSLDNAIAKLGELQLRFRNAYTFKANATGFWPIPDWTVVEPHQSSAAENTLHKFARPICVYTAAPTVDLSLFDLPNRIIPLLEHLDGMRDPSDALGQVFARLYQKYIGMTSVPPESQVLADIAESDEAATKHFAMFHEGAKKIHDMMTSYKLFQDALIEVGGRERERILKRIRRLDVQEQPWRNHFRFRGKGAAAKASKFLNQDPPPSGVMLVQDPDDPLVVNIRNLTGRLQIITSGHMTVRSATVRRPSDDVLILISYGRLAVDGPMTAGVISWNGGYETDNPQDFTGSLILDSVHPNRTREEIGRMFTGTLTFQKKLLSGKPGNKRREPPYPESLHIAFSPVPPYRRPAGR